MSGHNAVQHNKDRYVAIELAGVMSEYLVMPCQSLESRMRDTLRRYDSRIQAMIQAHQGVLENPPAEQHQGDAIGTLHRSQATEYGRIIFTPIGDPHIKDGMQVYTHADPGEVERLRIELSAVKFNLDKTDKGLLAADAEVRKLRAQLAERDALLREADEFMYIMTAHDGHAKLAHRYGKDWWDAIDKLRGKVCTALSASAEPSAPVERDERAEFDPLEWLETEISAVDTWYRGSPSYEHDAGWMKDQALRLVSEARAALERKS